MAESITLNFAAARWEEVRTVVGELATPGPSYGGDESWVYARGGARLILYEYISILLEYEFEDAQQLYETLERWPSSILCIEMHGNSRDETCDVVVDLATQILRRLEGAADDLFSECWTREDITSGARKSTGRFMDCYRYCPICNEILGNCTCNR